MNYSDYRFTLDVQIHQSQVSVPVTLGDSARRLCIGLTDGRKPYTIEDGCRAVFNAKKPDGSTIKNDCIIERNTILYEFTEQTTSVEGVVNCDITIYDTDGKVLTSPQFIIVVDKRAVRDGEIPLSESESTTLDKIITSEQDRQDTFVANEAARQDAFNTAEAERKADFDKFYNERYLNNIPVADLSFFERVNVLKGIELEKSADGTLWNGDGEIVSNNVSAAYSTINKMIDVMQGHRYRIPLFWGFIYLYDEDGKNGTQIVHTIYPLRDFEFEVPNGKTKIGITYGFNTVEMPTEMFRETPTKDEESRLPLKSERLIITPENIQSKETREFIQSNMGFETDFGAFKKPNVLEGVTLSRGEQGVVWNFDKTLTSNEYSGYYAPITNLIKVEGGHRYMIPRFYGFVYLYGNSEYGTKVTRVELPLRDFEFDVPANVTEIGITFRPDVMEMPSQMFRLTPTEEEKDILPLKIGRLSITPENIVNEDLLNIIDPKRNTVIVNFGDSIFGASRAPDDISTFLSKITGATAHNCGFGGCRMSYHPDPDFDAFSMTRLADAITTGDFTLQEKAVNNPSSAGVPDYFAEGLTTMKELDFSKVNIITIAFGTNDWNGVVLEGSGDKTFAGALRYSIETILTTYPHIKIFVCAPTYRFWMDANGTFTEDSDTKLGGTSLTLVDIVEKAREVAKECKVPFIDNYYDLGINKFNRHYYFSGADGTHHNLNGRKLIAEHIASCLF